jgi:hypothetical protein
MTLISLEPGVVDVAIPESSRRCLALGVSATFTTIAFHHRSGGLRSAAGLEGPTFISHTVTQRRCAAIQQSGVGSLDARTAAT